MGKVPLRKRLKHIKTHSRSKRRTVPPALPSEVPSELMSEIPSELPSALFSVIKEEPGSPVTDEPTCSDDDTSSNDVHHSMSGVSVAVSSDPSACTSPKFYDYCQTVLKEENNVLHGDSSAMNIQAAPIQPVQISSDLLLEVKQKLEGKLFHRWIPIIHSNAIHVVLISAESNISVQRSLVFFGSGETQLFVHCQPMDIKPYLEGIGDPITLTCESVCCFVNRILALVKKISPMNVCGGFNDERFKLVWNVIPFSEVDKNPYKECRYTETLRSISCLRLVKQFRWRCSECMKLYGRLKRKSISVSVEEPKPNTPNMYLSEDQKVKKLAEQRMKIENANKKIQRLYARMERYLKSGVVVDHELSKDLSDILNGSNDTAVQSLPNSVNRDFAGEGDITP